MLRALLVAACASSLAPAQVLTSASQMHADATLVTFETIASGAQADPFTLGELTFANHDPVAGLGVVAVTPWIPGSGGEVERQVLIPFAVAVLPNVPGWTSIEITFAQPIAEIGLGWFDPNYGGNRLRAYDAGGVLLLEATPATHPTGGCCASFVGLRVPTPQIARVQVLTDATGDDVYAIDDIRYWPCRNATTPRGAACPGSGGIAPTFASPGCTAPGATFRWRLANALGGAPAVVLFGTSPASVPLPGGCTLLLADVWPVTLPIALGGVGAGNGSGAVSLDVPHAIGVPFAFATQGVVLDAGTALGVVTTAALDPTIQ